jgi:hypothetical protein
MLSAPQRHVTLIAFFLVAPVLGLATTIDVNGGTLGPGQSTSGNFSTTVDGGLFDVSGYYTGSETGSGPVTAIVVNATATYEGSTPLASAYSFTIDDIQNYTLSTLPTTASYSGNAGFGGGLGAGSELIQDLSYGSDVLPALTFTADGHQSSPTEPLSGLSSPLEAQGELTFDFAAGATKGAYITSTPEPGGVIPIAAILVVGLGIPAIRRSRLLSKNMG